MTITDNLILLMLSDYFQHHLLFIPSGGAALCLTERSNWKSWGVGVKTSTAARTKLTAEFIRAPAATPLDAVAMETDAEQPGRGTRDAGGESGQSGGGGSAGNEDTA